MPREFRMPDIGEGLVEAEVTSWLVPVGGAVAMDQAVVEVETDKATTEIPTPFGGVVLHHGAAEGEMISVGDVLFVIGEPGEAWPGRTGGPDTGAASASTAGAGMPDTGEAPPIVGSLVDQADVLPPRPVPAAPPPERATAPAAPRGLLSPLVRRLALDRGVDVDRIEGSGPGGRVTREDVLRAAENGGAASTAPAPTRPASPTRGEERRELTKLRRTIADNISRSWREIPHVTSFYEVDAARLLQTRAKLATRHDTRIPVDAIVIAAVVPALRRFPEFNGALDGDTLVLHHHHDVGIAVDAPDGLVVAVVRNAGTRPLVEIAAEVIRLGAAARERKLAATDVGRQTFTISNIGAVAGGGHGTPIIPYGTAAILAVGRATEKPVVQHGALAIAPVMPLSFSYDHRIADGGTARRFMTMVVENLSDPALAIG